MKPLIIFEGADGVGKTTLARAIGQRLQATYTHHGAYAPLRPDQVARSYHLSMLAALYDVAPVVLDRAWISEPIYAEVFRSGYDRVLIGWRRMLERVLLTVPSLVVHLRAPFEVAWASVSQRPDQELAKRREQLERLYAGYERFASWPVRTLQLDRGARTPADLADLVMTAAPPASSPAGAATMAVKLGAIGDVHHSESSVLLVGERRSEVGSSVWMPFVNYTMGGCSAWLAELLEMQGVAEAGLTWVNAYGPDDVETPLDRIVELLRPRGVIALGQIAAAALTRAGVPHRAVPHPQFIKRFHHHDVESYALPAMIKELRA